MGLGYECGPFTRGEYSHLTDAEVREWIRKARETCMATGDVFAVGDVVRMRSGGPDMTVAAVMDDGDKLWCWWFYEVELCKAKIPVVLLQKVQPKFA